MTKRNVWYHLGVCCLLALFMSACSLISRFTPEAVKPKVAHIEVTLKVVELKTVAIKTALDAKGKKRIVSLEGIQLAGAIKLDQDIGQSPFGEATREAIKQLVDQLDGTSGEGGWTLPEEARIAVVKFENKSQLESAADIGEGTADLLITELVKRGKWQVIDKGMMEAILKENEMSYGDIVNPNTPVESRLKFAQYLLQGTITSAAIRGGVF